MGFVVLPVAVGDLRGDDFNAIRVIFALDMQSVVSQ
jgi:hypothetical protein